MSLNHLINESADVKYNVYCSSCECATMKVFDSLEVKDFFFDAKNGDKIELSSVADKGTFGAVMKSGGDGTMFFGSDLTGGVNFSGSQPTVVNQLSLFNSTDGTEIKNSLLVEQDLLDTQAKANTNESDITTLETKTQYQSASLGKTSFTGDLATDVYTSINTAIGDNATDITTLQTDKLNKLNDTATSLTVETDLNVKGQLNYASNLTNTLVDIGKWDVYSNPKGIATKVTGSFNPYVQQKFLPPSNPPTTSDEARTIIVYAGAGFLNKVNEFVEEIKNEYVSFVQTELIVSSNFNGVVRVNSSGVISLTTSTSFNTSQFFYLARVVTNTDSILFIDGKPANIRNYINEIFDTGTAIGTYFASGSALTVTETPTPLSLNCSPFSYYYNNVEYNAVGQSQLFFYRYYRDTGETLGYKQEPAVQYIDGFFDNGTNSLVPVPDGYFKKDLFIFINYVYETAGQRKYFIVYSTEVYPTLKDAQYAPSPPIPSFVPSSAVVLCNFITSVNGVNIVLEEIQDARKFLTAEIPYASRDNHSQYLLVDGTRPMEANLNMGGNNIFNVGLIDNLQASGGVYSKVDGNIFPNPPAILPVLPTDILSVGVSFGSRNIPANNFKAGSLFSLKIGGSLTCSNNDQFTISVGSNCGIAVNAGSFVIGEQYVISVIGTTDYTLIGSPNNLVGTAFIATGIGAGTGIALPVVIFCNQLVQVEGNQVNSYYELEIDFSIRAIGTSGVAKILTNGSFDYFNNTNVKKGYGFNQLNQDTFDTTIVNELCILYSSSAVDTFKIDVASITKFY